ncbi:hypothetical protein GGX14DRAFT_659451 [Mycena pura]|uniref:F-box domain-containing protein n=1 Tax=Mycena pura TaxID=153505 RepID=A0AAD6V1Y3_9AGAR|nr:hypothetical protein GGX14DRAFT_659451 [Mycena pura]
MPAAAGLRAQLAQIEESMAVLESQLASLRFEKHQLLQDLGEIVYPVTTLPAEITSEIFRHIIPEIRQSHSDEDEDRGDADDNVRHRYHRLLRLASVCRRWRAVVLSTCALWNSITVLCDIVRDPVKLLQAWLPRAGKLPLDLEIRLPRFDDCTIMSILGLYSSQWRRVHFLASASTIFPIEHFPVNLPLLETLILPGIASSDSVLGIGVLKEDEGLALTSLTLSHLHTFESTIHDLHPLVLRYLTLPALTHLKFRDLNKTGLQALDTYLSHSSPTIRTLDLSHTRFSIAHTCFVILPTLRHVSLTYPACSIRDVQNFDAAMKSARFLPSLESLTCKLNGFVVELAANFVNAISLRLRGVEGTTKLAAASISIRDRDIAEALGNLRNLGRRGLKLDINGTPVCTE